MAGVRENLRGLRRVPAALLGVAALLLCLAGPQWQVQAEVKQKDGHFSYEGDMSLAGQTENSEVNLGPGNSFSISCKNAAGTKPNNFPPKVCLSAGVSCRDNCSIDLLSVLGGDEKAIQGTKVDDDKPLVIQIPDTVNVPVVFSFTCIGPKGGHNADFNVYVGVGAKNARTWSGTDPDAYSAAFPVSVSVPGVLLFVAAALIRVISN